MPGLKDVCIFATEPLQNDHTPMRIDIVLEDSLLVSVSDMPHFKTALAVPFRVGDLADRLMALSEKRMHIPQKLDLAFGILDMARHEMVIKDSAIRLTHKEAALLQALFDAGKAGLSRDKILSDVWGYADGIDTHTLETHIYRLRQKIEPDATSPAYLKTTKEGYALKF